MSKTVKEFVTHWGPSLNDWGDGTEQRFVIERDEKLLKQGIESGGRRMQKLSLNDIFKDGVVTGVDMENGYLPLVLYANEDLIIEVANCDREQGGWHRNLGADEWAFQYKGSRPAPDHNWRSESVGHGPNIEITVYARKPLKRLAPLEAEAARRRMKIKNGKPVEGPLTLDSGE